MNDNDRLPSLYADLERLGAEAAQWADVEASGSTEVVHVGSGDPEKLRERMIEVRREAWERSSALAEAADQVRNEIRRELDRQRAEMEARMREAMAALEPLQAQVKRMEEGIWTVNLYLGTSEEIVTLRSGTPAAVETPITLRTTVLAMDEEVASFPVENGEVDWQGMDYRDVESFDRWLTEDPEHLAQVLPEPRGIVVFTPRRTAKIYAEDPLINSAMNEGNFESYWLIRNGENLHRLKTNFLAGSTLMPVASEFTRLFQTQRYNPETHVHETVDVLPGTGEWERAEKAQDTKRRHYMRVALIVQGLIDRTEIFEPLHAAVNVMRQGSYDDGLVVVVDDTDKTLTTGREPYSDWIRRLNADLRPGMRIIGTFRGPEWDQHEFRGDRWSTAEGNSRVYPNKAERPPVDTLLRIEGRKDFNGKQALVVKYKRTVPVYDPNLWVDTSPGWGHRGGERVPTTRASAVILPTDQTIIPFDLVTEADMQAYLDARTERHAYADMFPLLQAAIAAKRDEREAEAPFRDLLTRVLTDDNNQDISEVEPHVDALVHRFKLGNKWHRPLVSLSQEDEAKALRLIRAEYQRIVNSGANDARDLKAVATLRAHDSSVMFVGRLSSGKYVAFAPQPTVFPSDVTLPNVWVREHTTGKTASDVKSRDWVVPGVRGNKMTPLFTDDRWTDWNTVVAPKDVVTDSELTDLITEATTDGMRRIRKEHGPQPEFLAVAHDPAKHVIVVFASDGIHTAPKRSQVADEKHKARWFATAVTWKRSGAHVSIDVRGSHPHVQDWAFKYVGMWDKVADSEREIMLPWAALNERKRFAMAVINSDAAVLDTAVRVFRETREVNRVIDDLKARIREALQDVEHQQRLNEEAVIKAKFLAEYPDEHMWEERRGVLTKNVKAAVAVTDNFHFKVRDREVGDGAWTMRPVGDADLRAVLSTLNTLGLTWTGLTVRDAYRLADVTWPSLYDSIADLVLRVPSESSERESHA